MKSEFHKHNPQTLCVCVCVYTCACMWGFWVVVMLVWVCTYDSTEQIVLLFSQGEKVAFAVVFQ